MPQLSCIQTVQDDYDARVEEIEGYFAFVGIVDSGHKHVIAAIKKKRIDDTALFKTLKANCFLLLYNLMEAVTKRAIQGVYEHLKNENVCYDDCCIHLKKVVLKNVKGLSVENAYARLGVIVRHIVSETFVVENLLSGNVYHETLRTLANQYGFSPQIASQGSDGLRLEEVKNKRNLLAHGDMTFDEVGKDATFQDLIDIKKNVIIYMQQFIINVDDYLKHRLYLDPSSTTVASATAS